MVNKCSGLGLKLGRYIPYLTDEIISYADQNNFPIISIPDELKWADIIVPIVTELNKLYQHKLEMNQEVYMKFHNHLKNKGNLNDLARLLEEIIDTSVTIYIRKHNKVINAGEPLFKKSAIEYITSSFLSNQSKMMQQLKIDRSPFTVRWIVNSTDDTLDGGIFLWYLEKPLQTWEQIALEQAAVIISLEIERYKTLATTYQKLRNDFLLKLIDKNPIPEAMVNKHSKELSWNIGDYNRVILLDHSIEGQDISSKALIWRKKSNVLEVFEGAIKGTTFKNTPIGFDNENRILMLVPKKTNYRELLNIINATIVRLNLNYFYGGIGNLKSLQDLHKSHLQAEIALNSAYNQNHLNDSKKRLFTRKFENLHIERILFSNNPKEEAINFAKYLERVIDYDYSRNGELIATLRAFIANNFNFDDTA